MASSPPDALAYLSWGRWVVDCPAELCTDSRLVCDPLTGQPRILDMCFNGHPFTIVMPPDAAAIEQAVAGREERDRFWYPQAHPRAEELDLPRGLDIAQVEEQTAEIIAQRAEEEQA